MNIITHCCADLEFFLNEKKVSIGYSNRFRSYYLRLLASEGAQRIAFCPWCGSRLPEALDDEYDIELSKVLGIDVSEIDLNTYNNPSIPQEFKTDEWWKKRGL